MKYFFTALVLLAFVITNAQETTPPLTKEQLLKKSKGQLFAGLAFSASGTTLIIISLNQMGNNVNTSVNNFFSPFTGDEVRDPGSDGSALFIAGAACIVASVPFYIAAGKNKNKASKMTASFAMNQAQLLCHSGKTQKLNYPAFTIKVRL